MTSARKTIVGELSGRYVRQPALRALLKLIPGWGSADGLIQTRADEIKRERLRAFFDELANGQTVLSSELIESEDFLHCFFKTTHAALHTRRREKIAMFACMLKGALRDGTFSEIEDYEELLSVIDSISYRQFAVLCLLRGYEIQYSGKHFENNVQRVEAYWDKFRKKACASLGIDEVAFQPFMTRLEATGLYARNIGGWGSNPSIGTTTKILEKLSILVENKEQHHCRSHADARNSGARR